MRYRGPIVKDILFLGGGHGNALALRQLGARRHEGIGLTLVAEESYTPYLPMFPGLILGAYSFEESHIDLRALCKHCGATFILAQVEKIDPVKKLVSLSGRAPLTYDLLSLSQSRRFLLQSVAETGGSGEAGDRSVLNFQRRLLRIFETLPERKHFFVVVGGGFEGVDLILALQTRIEQLTPGKHEFHFVEKEHKLLKDHNMLLRRKITEELSTRGIKVHTGERVVQVTSSAVYCGSGKSIPADHVFWTIREEPPSWLASSTLQLNEKGFVQVTSALHSTSHSDVFASGCIAYDRTDSLRKGRLLYRNIRASADGKPLKHGGLGQRLEPDIAGPRWLGEQRDRGYMAQFTDLPPLDEAQVRLAPDTGNAHELRLAALKVEARVRCRGGGAKVSAGVLQGALARLKAFAESQAGLHSVLSGLEELEDAAVLAAPPGKLLLQSVDFLPAIVDDAHLFGRIAINHCASDIFAMGAVPQSVLSIIEVPFGKPQKMEETVFQALAGAACQLAAWQTRLLGGHTGESQRLALGFVVNGVSATERLLKKSGMNPGEALVLTKSLGTGTLFASEMRLSVKARWIDGALESMVQDNKLAGESLRAHGASACTDVTGFGLAGHLLEMATASNLSARIRLSELPVLEGALETLGRGGLSSLHTSNAQAARFLKDPEAFHGQPRFNLLFDPQTSGGLLASLPQARAQECVDDLRRKRYAGASIIGTVEEKTADGPRLFLES